MAEFRAFPVPKYCERCDDEMPWRTVDDVCYHCRVQVEQAAIDAAEERIHDDDTRQA
jgi:hypothetical protein